MKLYKNIRNKYIEEKQYNKFDAWLNDILCENIFPNVAAYYFCLHEGLPDDFSNIFHLQLIGTDIFDEEDEDWACSEIYYSRPNYCEIIGVKDWENAQEVCVFIVSKYLKNGKYANRLKASQGVGVGFCNGNIEIVYNINI